MLLQSEHVHQILGRQVRRIKGKKFQAGGESNPNPFRHTYPQLHTLPTYMYLYLFMIDLATAQGTWHNTSPSKLATLDECPFPQFSPRQ